jgi:hypothetical protein
METMESKHKPLQSKGLKILMTVGLILIMATSAAWAVGTPSGTNINNRATIDYSVGGVNQEDIESSPAGNSTSGAGAGADTTFVVDNRVDLTVASQGNTNVSTNQQNAALEFLLTNVGNTTQGYLLEAVNGAPLDIPMANVEIWIESGATPGFQDTEDALYVAGNNAGDRDPNTGTATDAQLTVYIVADAPASATNGDTDTYWLRATTTNAGTTTPTPNTGGADNPAAVDNVLADADGDAGGVDAQYDGRHADSGDFVVAASSLTVTKTHAVYSDPINNTTNPKAIPGAVIEYTVGIVNAGGSAIAQSVTVSDDLTALVTGAPAQMAFDVNGYAAGYGMRMRTDTGAGWGAWTNLSNASDADTGDWNVTNGNTVTVNCGNLDATHRAEVQFRLVIQ